MTATTPADAALEPAGAPTGARRLGGRSSGLDFLRAAACVLVTIFHLRTVLGVDFGPLNRIVEGGDAGVYIFFALSGYLLYRPFVKGDVDLGDYSLKRAARILPGYFVALVALLALTQNPLPLAHPLPYLTMTASYNVELRGFLGNAWTLSAELIFYVLLPVFARFAAGDEIRRLAIVALGSITLSLVYLMGFYEGNEWLLGAFPFVAYAFVPGMLLAVIEVRRPSLFARFSTPWVPIVGLLGILVETQLRAWPIALGAGIGTPLLIGWLLSVRVPFAKALSFAGGASYALYLWHKDLFISFGVAGLLIAIVGSALSWALVERPILDRAHALAARRRLAVKPTPIVTAAPL
jgi:peptidoglycan/LPS O-acetylase OafA/YrhL